MALLDIVFLSQDKSQQVTDTVSFLKFNPTANNKFFYIILLTRTTTDQIYLALGPSLDPDTDGSLLVLGNKGTR